MSLTADIDDRAVRLRLEAMPERLRQALIRAVTYSAIDVQAKVMKKLAGPVLNERTHRLHDSIHEQVDSNANSVMGVVGTDVVYAKVHELGGAWQIRAHLRRMTMAFGRPGAEPRDILVRAHTANYPQRSFLRSTLVEETPAIKARMEEAVRQAAAT